MSRRPWVGIVGSAARSRAGGLPFLLAPLLVLVTVWVPEVEHYRAPEIAVSETMVDAAVRAPSEDVLAELRSFSLLPIPGRSPELEVSLAEQMLNGRLALPGLPEASFSLQFDPRDFDRLPASLQLWYAGFIVPDVLLAAYVDTGREAFFAAARDFITSWDAFEQGTWLPVGLLWNDHAVAARTQVLVEFWRIYRARHDARSDVDRNILEQAARYGWFLSSPGQFTFATNHGLMQNLGLLELSLAFPNLPRHTEYLRVALDRLGEQLPYFIDAAGAIRENSAGYQAFDLRILAMTFRSMTLLGEPIPVAWAEEYSAATRFLAIIRRPDGTLPANGDTDGAPGEPLLVTEIDGAGRASAVHTVEPVAADPGETLDPDGGYWIRWSGLQASPSGDGMSQTTAIWTRPPAPGHKHADDMSVLLWSDGVSWITNSGYWPYDDRSRGLAESWDGSNAPHLADEGASSERVVQVLGSASSSQFAVLDLERLGPGSYRVRRQVIQVEPGIWVILDVTSGAGAQGNRTIWTVPSDVDLTVDGPGSYGLHATDGREARLYTVASPGTSIETYRGSLDPFAGWQVRGGSPLAAPAIRVNQPGADAWFALMLTRQAPSATGDPVGAPRVSAIDTPTAWTITISTSGGDLVITRSDESISLSGAGRAASTIELAPQPQSAHEALARAAFESAAARYPVFSDLTTRRQAVTFAVLLLVLSQEVVLELARRRLPKAYLSLRAISVVGWIAVGLVVSLVVLKSWTILALAGG